MNDSMLETYIRDQRRRKDILLMTHIVIGYPSLDASLSVIEAMIAAGVDLMELQIPFSEPIADGPVILKANQDALANGVTVTDCLSLAREVARRFSIPFLLMTYYNILFKHGLDRFAQTISAAHIRGTIIPDLPHEEGHDYIQAMQSHGVDPIFLFAPTTTDARMALIARNARGFIYCVARKGVTGRQTDFSRDLEQYLRRCRRCTDLPLALGFGVQDKADVSFLRGRADIAVIGTQTIRIMAQKGITAVGDFIHGLR